MMIRGWRIKLRTTATVFCLIALGALTPRAHAQTAPFTDVPDHYLVEVGGFNVEADTELRFSSARLGGTTIDFESDLGLPDVARRGFVDTYWRAGRRHLVNFSFNRLHREGPGRTRNRDIEWGGAVYPAGVTLIGRVNSDHLSGAYRFAAFRNDRVEVGPSIGLGYLWITAGLRSEFSVGGVSVDLDHENTTGSITGDVGGYFQWWAAKRVLVRGDLRYVIIKPERSEASVTEGRASVSFYPWQKVGFGAQYTYTKFRYDRDVLSTELSGRYRYGGAQILASFAF